MWRRAQPIVERGLERGRRELNETRARLGLAELDHVHGGISTGLAIVATSAKAFRPSFLPSTASRRRSASVNRNRFFPSRSIRARFTVFRCSMWSV